MVDFDYVMVGAGAVGGDTNPMLQGNLGGPG
jgi:hypothetical protein